MRIVLDTNQLVRALMRPPQLSTFLMAWESKRFTVVSSHALLEEYLLVLDYPEIAELIYPELRRLFFTQLRDEIEMVELPEIPRICRDPDDDKVIATALYGLVDYLVTSDEDLCAKPVVKLLGKEGINISDIDEIIMKLT
ncbi:MAG: putative toxin-antitoxin system toxin component, PIN family [Caldilineaceae bacterium]